MTNRHGEFIWYELMTTDVEAARAFYEPVVGWKIGAASAMPGTDYRMIAGSDGAEIAGALALDEEMRAGGARPVWVGYIAVDDVDATAQAIPAMGGQVHVPPQDIPGVGRFAMASDPHGAPFYVMRGTVEGGSSTAFSVDGIGHCGWNELSSPDQKTALQFYTGLFGWTNPESMPMGEMGDYHFLCVDDLRIGASMEDKSHPAHWRHYFRVPSVGVATRAIEAGQGQVLHGPHEVPGGDIIIIAVDPQGAQFALVGGH